MFLTRLFGGDKQAKQIVDEFDQCSRIAYGHEEPEYDKFAYRATDLFIENDLYGYSVYACEQQGIEETGLPEE